jgi:hypothetical protein
MDLELGYEHGKPVRIVFLAGFSVLGLHPEAIAGGDLIQFRYEEPGRVYPEHFLGPIPHQESSGSGVGQERSNLTGIGGPIAFDGMRA